MPMARLVWPAGATCLVLGAIIHRDREPAMVLAVTANRLRRPSVAPRCRAPSHACSERGGDMEGS